MSSFHACNFITHPDTMTHISLHSVNTQYVFLHALLNDKSFILMILLLKGCTKAPHNKEKPPEPVKPDVSSSGEKKEVDEQKPKFSEYIISAPKPQGAFTRPR